MPSRYERVIAIDSIGASGQARICRGRVLVVGCGALGSLVGMYLAGGGVGTITVADFDTVSLSNLHRQIMFSESQTGQPKADRLADRMRAVNSEVTVDVLRSRITAADIAALAHRFDIVADCTDNAATKHVIASAVCRLGKTCVTGGVFGTTVQVVVSRPDGPTYNDLFGDADNPRPGIIPVLGPAAGVAASLQASAVMLTLSGNAPSYSLLTLDVATGVSAKF